MSNRKKVVKLYHVRYVADFLVPATSNREAFDVADEEFTDMIEGDEQELDDIFNISIVNERFHVVEIIPEDEDDEDTEDESEDEDDDSDDESEDEDDEEED